jgi:hypothetical protein
MWSKLYTTPHSFPFQTRHESCGNFILFHQPTGLFYLRFDPKEDDNAGIFNLRGCEVLGKFPTLADVDVAVATKITAEQTN